MCSLTALPLPITNKPSIDRSVNHVAQFLQYELCWIKAVLDSFNHLIANLFSQRTSVKRRCPERADMSCTEEAVSSAGHVISACWLALALLWDLRGVSMWAGCLSTLRANLRRGKPWTTTLNSHRPLRWTAWCFSSKHQTLQDKSFFSKIKSTLAVK